MCLLGSEIGSLLRGLCDTIFCRDFIKCSAWSVNKIYQFILDVACSTVHSLIQIEF